MSVVLGLSLDPLKGRGFFRLVLLRVLAGLSGCYGWRLMLIALELLLIALERLRAGAELTFSQLPRCCGLGLLLRCWILFRRCHTRDAERQAHQG